PPPAERTPSPGRAAPRRIADAKGQPLSITVLNADGQTEVKPLPDAANRAQVGLPVVQDTGNLEGKELRFGPAAGPTWAAATTVTSNGSVNCMHDSLNPLAGITPFPALCLTSTSTRAAAALL